MTEQEYTQTQEQVPVSLLVLSETLHPLYLVGGCIRDYLLDKSKGGDYDIAGTHPVELVAERAEACGFTVCAVYPNTGTMKLKDKNGTVFEYSRFRRDFYRGGDHSPVAVSFTDDLPTDARRRDFTVNAIYYEIYEGRLIDPLGGLKDLREKRLKTVARARNVFSEDGVRLMRMARFAAQLNFQPDDECMTGAREHAMLIHDVAPERIFEELQKLLVPSNHLTRPHATYRGLAVLRDAGIMQEILPELVLGNGLYEDDELYRHDVLEHSLRCCAYSDESVRLAALLHDVGKPFCHSRYGNFDAHAEEGARITGEILRRLKAPNQVVSKTQKIVALHMTDADLQMKESELRPFFVKNSDVLHELIALKQADHYSKNESSASSQTVAKWDAVLQQMYWEGCPLKLSELKVNGNDAVAAGLRGSEIGAALSELMDYCAEDGFFNERGHLLELLKRKAEKKQ